MHVLCRLLNPHRTKPSQEFECDSTRCSVQQHSEDGHSDMDGKSRNFSGLVTTTYPRSRPVFCSSVYVQTEHANQKQKGGEAWE